MQQPPDPGLDRGAEQRGHRLHVHRIAALLRLRLEDAHRVDQYVVAAQAPHQFPLRRQCIEVQRQVHPLPASREDHLMTRLPQPARDRAADHPAPPGHHDPQAPGWRAVLLRALGSGAVASIISTLVVSARSRWRSGSVPAGTNAASQWVWDWPARHASGWSARHTLLGYAIHHASSLLWAGGYEAWGHRRPAEDRK